MIFLADTKGFFTNLFVKKSNYFEIDPHEEKFSESEKLQFMSIDFYSTRFLILHLLYLTNFTENKKEYQKIIIDKFTETHPFDSLDDFIDRFIEKKSDYNDRINIMESNESEISLDHFIYRSNISRKKKIMFQKHIVLTYTNCEFLNLKEEIEYKKVQVSTLNEKGSWFLDQIFDEFIESKKNSFFFILFNSKSDMKHLKFLKNYFETFQIEKKDHHLKQIKNIVFIIHKEIDLDKENNGSIQYNWELNFTNFSTNNLTETKWNFVVIENLNDSFYK